MPYLNVKRRRTSVPREEIDDVFRTFLGDEPEGPFSSLLPELLETVFSYLGVTDKGRAACVCRHWRRVCYSRFLWEKEEAKLDLQQTTKQALRSIQDRGIARIQILSFSSSFTSVTKSFSNLSCLRLTGCYNTTDAMLRKAFSSPLNSLKECDLSLCKQVRVNEVECMFLGLCAYLYMYMCLYIMYVCVYVCPYVFVCVPVCICR